MNLSHRSNWWLSMPTITHTSWLTGPITHGHVYPLKVSDVYQCVLRSSYILFIFYNKSPLLCWRSERSGQYNKKYVKIKMWLYEHNSRNSNPLEKNKKMPFFCSSDYDFENVPVDIWLTWEEKKENRKTLASPDHIRGYQSYSSNPSANRSLFHSLSLHRAYVQLGPMDSFTLNHTFFVFYSCKAVEKSAQQSQLFAFFIFVISNGQCLLLRQDTHRKTRRKYSNTSWRTISE